MAHQTTPKYDTMRAVIFDGTPFQVKVREVSKARIILSTDAVVRITSSSICGSDLHNFNGILGGKDVPFALGHEAVGIVSSIGEDVKLVKVGDRVVVPDVPESGVRDSDSSLKDSTEIYGEGKLLGDLGGCQAEFLRVPIADRSLIVLGPEFDCIEDDVLLLTSDNFSTGWAGLDWTGFVPGDEVAIFGAGTVGLLAAYSALLRGASRVYSVDHNAKRLAVAASIGAYPIDITNGSPSAQILALSPGGVPRTIDAVGEIAVNGNLKPDQGYVVNEAVACTSVSGGIAVLGVYLSLPVTKGAQRAFEVTPSILFPISDVWLKNLTIRSGVVSAIEVAPPILALIKNRRADPSFVYTRTINIEEAPQAYERLAAQLDIKVLIKFA